MACPVAAQDAPPAPELGHWMVAISVDDLDAETAFFGSSASRWSSTPSSAPAFRCAGWSAATSGSSCSRSPNSKPSGRGKPPGHAALHGFSQVTLSTSDIEATKAALVAQGLTPAMDITEVAPLGVKVMYFQDPEGNAIEIAQKL